MGDWWKGVLKFLIVVISVGVGYFFSYLWVSLSQTPVSEMEQWIVGIVVFFASVVGFYYGSRLKE